MHYMPRLLLQKDPQLVMQVNEAKLEYNTLPMQSIRSENVCAGNVSRSNEMGGSIPAPFVQISGGFLNPMSHA